MAKQLKQKNPYEGIRLDDLYKEDPEFMAAMEDILSKAPKSKRTSEIYSPQYAGAFISGFEVPQIPEYGESRYDEVAPTSTHYLDYENLRGERQPWYDKIKNGILKGAVTTGTTFANTLIGIPTGLLTAAVEGRLSGIWDNAVTNTMADIDDWAEKELPNYYTAAEQNSPWYQNIFTANFLGDKLIKNFGFTFGAAGAGKVISRMPKVLTTIAPKIAKATGATTQNIASIGRVANTLETDFISAVGEGSIEALQATKEWSATMTNRINQEQSLKLQELQQEYEAGLAAIQQQYGNTEIYNQLALNYQNEMQQKARAIENETNQKMAQVASQRAQLGNAVLGFNLPILTLSNMALLGRIYDKGWSAEQQSLGRFISSDMSKLAVAGTTTSKTTRNILGKEITKDVVNNVYKNDLNLARHILRVGKQNVGEGLEEMAQLIASNTAKAYNDDYYAQSVDPNATNRTANMWYSLAEQFGETLGDINNWEEFFIGMASSGFSNIVLGANKGLSQERRDVQNLVDALNERVNTFNNRNLIQGLNRHGQYGDQMVESAIRGDKKDFKDAEFAQTVSDVIMWSEAGKIDDLKQIIDYNLDNNLTDEELESIAESLSQKDAEGGEHNSFAAGSNSYRRQYIQDQKDKYHKVVDMYTKERENLVGLVGNTFNKEELSELTYLRLRAQDSANRSEELQNNLLNKIDTFAQRNLVQQAATKTDFVETSQLKTILRNRLKSDEKLLQELDWNIKATDYMGQNQSGNYYINLKKRVEKRIDNAKKLLAKDFANAVENEQKFAYLKELLGVQTANNETYTSALDFIRDNFKKAIELNANKLNANNVIEVAQNIDDLVSILSNIKTQDTTIKELETTIEDAIRLVNDANNYNKKLNEFINNPSKITNKNEGLAERARNRKLNKEADRVEQDIADTEDFNEFSQKLDSLDARVKDRVLKRLKEKQNQNALDYESKTQKINLVLNYIANSEVEPKIKQLSTALFDSAARVLPEKDLFNIDNNIYSRENNQQLDDDTYVKVKTLLAEAFKFQDNETSEPIQEDAINIEEKPVTTKSQSDIEMANVEFANPQERFEELQTELSEEGEVAVNFNEQSETQAEVKAEQIIPATPQTHGFKENDIKTAVTTVNIADNNLTSKDTSVDEKQIPNKAPVAEPETKGAMAMGQQEFDKKGENKGKESPDSPLKRKLKELGVFDRVDNGFIQKGDKVYFGLCPSIDKQTKEENNFEGTTILLFKEGQCVGHLPNASENSAGKRLGIANLLLEEFKGKLDTEDVLISNKYFTTVDEIWKGIVLYNGQEYRRITDDDFAWIRNRINSSTTTKEDRTPLITIFDGSTEFRKDANTIFRYGINVPYIYMEKNQLYKGAPVLLVPTAAYDRNKSNTLQDVDAYIPVALRRVKLSDISSDSETYKEIVSTISTLFQPNLTVRQLNQAIGTLKSKITYEFNSTNGKQQIFIVPAKQRIENGRPVIDNNGNPVIIESTTKMYDSINTKYEDTKVTHLIIQRKVDGKTVSTYTMGISQGNIFETQALPKDIQDNNKQALLDFLTKEADAYVNIDQTKLNNPDYIQKIIDEGLLQTNAKELRTVANSFHMVEKVMTDTDIQTEQKPEESTISSSTEPLVTTSENDNILTSLLGDGFDATKQAETEGEDSDKYSRVTETTSLGTIDVESEVKNIMRMLPQLDRETAFDIIDSLYTINDKGDQAQGIFNRGLITLSRLAEAGTGYHEAFHLVYNMILNEEEKSAVLAEYKLSHPNLNELELEEQMAEDFKEYSLLKEHSIVDKLERSSFGQKLLKLFDKICNLLNIQRNNPSVFQTISANIWQGKYAGRELKPTDAFRLSDSRISRANRANITIEDYNRIEELVGKINDDYRKGRRAGSFAVQFRTKGSETGFFLTDNSEHKYVNGKETIIYHPEISKDFVEKYLKDNNLTNQFELKTNGRGDTKIMIRPDANIKDKNTENSYVDYQRLVYKQREGYTLTPEEDYELQSYPNKFNTEEVCG